MTVEDMKKQKRIPDLYATIDVERGPEKNSRGGGAFSNGGRSEETS
jgi:hypothetical protein